MQQYDLQDLKISMLLYTKHIMLTMAYDGTLQQTHYFITLTRELVSRIRVTFSVCVEIFSSMAEILIVCHHYIVVISATVVHLYQNLNRVNSIFVLILKLW